MQATVDCRRIIIADDGSGDERMRRYLQALKKNRAAEIVHVNAEQPLPETLNACACKAAADLLLFLNGNIEILSLHSFANSPNLRFGTAQVRLAEKS